MHECNAQTLILPLFSHKCRDVTLGEGGALQVALVVEQVLVAGGAPPLGGDAHEVPRRGGNRIIDASDHGMRWRHQRDG
jgi:hypothetical protein